MLPARYRSRIHAIATNRKSGAIELAVEVVEAFRELTASPCRPSRNEINTVVSFLAKAQPSMVPIQNAARMSARVLAGGGDAADRLKLLSESIASSRDKVAANCLKLFPPDATCITLSRSSTVLAALRLAVEGGRLDSVYVMESRPRMEGRATATELIRVGVNCTIVADALGPSLAGEVGLAVVGADAVLRDGAVINKIGTYPLSLACRDIGTPFHVLAESVKLDSRFATATWPGSELRDERELLPRQPGGMKAINRYFDLTPPANITAVVHEGGVSRKGWAGDLERLLRRNA